jgi:hypothetical protein
VEYPELKNLPQFLREVGEWTKLRFADDEITEQDIHAGGAIGSCHQPGITPGSESAVGDCGYLGTIHKQGQGGANTIGAKMIGCRAFFDG